MLIFKIKSFLVPMKELLQLDAFQYQHTQSHLCGSYKGTRGNHNSSLFENSEIYYRQTKHLEFWQIVWEIPDLAVRYNPSSNMKIDQSKTIIPHFKFKVNWSLSSSDSYAPFSQTDGRIELNRLIISCFCMKTEVPIMAFFQANIYNSSEIVSKQFFNFIFHIRPPGTPIVTIIIQTSPK